MLGTPEIRRGTGEVVEECDMEPGQTFDDIIQKNRGSHRCL